MKGCNLKNMKPEYAILMGMFVIAILMLVTRPKREHNKHHDKRDYDMMNLAD